MKKYTYSILITLVMVFSCTTNDVMQESPNQTLEFVVTEDQSVILNDLIDELGSSPSKLEGSRAELVDFLVQFLNKRGYHVDLKNYNEVLYPVSKDYNVEIGLNSEITNHVELNGLNNNSFRELALLKQDILVFNKDLSPRQIEYLESDIAFWQYISSNEKFLELYRNEIDLTSGVARTESLKCALGVLKFGINFTLCVLGNIKSCLLLPLDGLSLALSCRSDDDYVDPCEGISNPCCGVSCVQGYECVNGNCIEDPYFDNCNNCLPGEECVNGICRPF